VKIKLNVLKMGGNTEPHDAKVLETMPGFGRQTFFVDLKEFGLKGHVLWLVAEADPEPEPEPVPTGDKLIIVTGLVLLAAFFFAGLWWTNLWPF
jgi:hypothetical protein